MKVGPSPAWLKNVLEKVGLRSINNVVDVTNFVMLEIGQPLHAFDYHLLKSDDEKNHPTIIVRRAQEGEKFTTLDGQPRNLTHENLLIADETRGIALAGVMGGQNSEINENTKDVLLESACFNPTNIRRTSKTLGLRTDASYRYERGADIGICDWASQRAAQLILETAGGELIEGVVDAFPNLVLAKEISLRFKKTDALLGLEIAPENQVKLLRNLGLLEISAKRTDQSATFSIPTFRVDLKNCAASRHRKNSGDAAAWCRRLECFRFDPRRSCRRAQNSDRARIKRNAGTNFDFGRERKIYFG